MSDQETAHTELQTALTELGKQAKSAARRLAIVPGPEKNAALLAAGEQIMREAEHILAANAADVHDARQHGLAPTLLDRLILNPTRLEDMVQGLRDVAALPDPVGEVEEMHRRPNGLMAGKMRVPLGVVGMVFEARPNVVADAAGLCLKSGNACILRGGSEAFRSNQAIAACFAAALAAQGLPPEAVQLVPTTDRAAVGLLARLDRYVDVIIARGGESLMTGLAGATVPLFRHGKGICHVYVDAGADLEAAARIVLNAKCQRPGVCNALETLLVHTSEAARFLPVVGAKLQTAGVELRGCPEALRYLPEATPASDQDWATEYLALILSVKVVPDFNAAIAHIARFGSGHSEAIVTRDYARAKRFVNEVDAAAVFVNASTRFNDGSQLGLGAEIGISTQKLHARGPMGVRELTTTKWVVLGEGQVR